MIEKTAEPDESAAAEWRKRKDMQQEIVLVNVSEMAKPSNLMGAMKGVQSQKYPRTSTH